MTNSVVGASSGQVTRAKPVAPRPSRPARRRRAGSARQRGEAGQEQDDVEADQLPGAKGGQGVDRDRGIGQEVDAAEAERPPASR